MTALSEMALVALAGTVFGVAGTGVGGLLGVDRQLFPKDCEGLYTTGRTTLAVSRGLGGVRLFNRPHLPTLVLKRAQP